MHLPDFILLAIATLAAIAAGIGAALLALTSQYHRAVRGLFWLAGLAFGSLGIVWALTSTETAAIRFLVGIIIVVTAAVGLAWGLALVRKKERLAETESSTTKSPSGINISGNNNIVSLQQAGDIHVAKEGQPSPTPISPQPKSLADFFKNDFENTLRLDSEVTIEDKASNKKYAVKIKAFFDFSAGTWFAGFYIPRTPITFDIGQMLSRGYMPLFEQLKQGLGAIAKSPGDSSAVDIGELTFSKRVYIYHEDFLTLKEQSDLTEAFKARGTSLILRGPDYVSSRFVGDQLKAKR